MEIRGILGFLVSVSPLSLSGKRWAVPALTHRGSEQLLSQLASARGIDLDAQATFESLELPHSLGDMEMAVERFRKAITNKETVGIIGDYDADGITGTAQLVRLCQRHNIPHHVILPHRQEDGYGVKLAFIEKMQGKGVTLLLTVDTGITYPSELNNAHSRGIDVIVLDHHTPGPITPEGFLVHPTVRGEHMNPFVSGSGVAFTFVRAVENNDWQDRDVDIALAAIGTVADVVPLVGENRTIVQLGLEALTRGKNHPVFELSNAVRKNGEATTAMHIGFRIAPRINAAGRIRDPLLSLTALLEGGEALERLSAINNERQSLTIEMLEEAEHMVDREASLIAIASEDFHPGIVGLIAGRLTENHHRPALIGVMNGEEVTCSLRSIEGYNIAEALSRCSTLLSSHGGHAKAGGCTVPQNNWDSFCSELLEDASSHIQKDDLIPTLTVDAELNAGNMDLALVKQLSALEPFGEGNPEPRFLLRNCPITNTRFAGAAEQHLQCRVAGMKSIGFGLGSLYSCLPEKADVVCRIGMDDWQGLESVQLFLEDIAETERNIAQVDAAAVQ